MKPYLFFATAIFFGLLIAPAHTYNQSEACYSQCAGWKLIWQDDYAWDYVEEFCSIDAEEMSWEMVSMWADYVLQEVSFTPIMNAFVCADVINDYIAPQLQACRQRCAENNLSYAPNLFVSEDTVYYEDGAGRLHITVKNNGRAYMPSAEVTVYAGSSDSVNDSPKMQRVTNRTLTDFRPSDVRYAPENMEPERAFVVNWAHKKDKYNVVRVVVAADPKIKETSVADNTYDLVVNDLPTPASFSIEGANAVRVEPHTDTYYLTTTIMNRGEVAGIATVKYYLGHASGGHVLDEEAVGIGGNSTAVLDKEIIFPGPRPSYVTITVDMGGRVVDERTVFMAPQFLVLTGKITDEAKRPINDAIVSSDLGGGYGQATHSDESGHYRMPEYFTDEGTIPIYAHKVGYSPNSTTITFDYNENDSRGFDDERIVYVDLTLLQNPGGVSVQYPARGWYIIETDKGRFTGEYAPNATLPIQGNNGTIAIFSPSCSAYVSNFSLKYSTHMNLTPADVRCLTPDSNDEYELLGAPVEMWKKQYAGEEARMAVFSKNGRYAYVMTADTETNFCTLYSYDMVSGSQKYRLPFNTACGQHSKLSPSYDGSTLYAGVGAVGGSIKGFGIGTMYAISENGEITYNFTKGDALDTLETTSATQFTDIMGEAPNLMVPGYGKLETCMMIANRTCDPPGGKYALDVLGITKNRALGECDGKPCIFSLGKPEYLTLDSGHLNNPQAEGNYANDDVFIGNYAGGAYYAAGEPQWSVDEDIVQVSMSPGGRYVALSYDPYGIGIYLASGSDVTPTRVKDKSALGIAATEQGIVYATHAGSNITFYRISNLVEPTSSTTSGGAAGSTSFLDFVFETLVEWYNAFIAQLHYWFGGI